MEKLKEEIINIISKHSPEIKYVDAANAADEIIKNHIKHLQHHKDTTVGLNATDKPIGNLLQMFWQRSSDACPLECVEAEKQEMEFARWVKTVSWVIS